MPRPPNIRPTVSLHFKLDKELKSILESLLYSEVEGRVPVGAYQEFIETRLREYFTWGILDLRDLPNLPILEAGISETHIRGPQQTLAYLAAMFGGTYAFLPTFAFASQAADSRAIPQALLTGDLLAGLGEGAPGSGTTDSSDLQED